MRDRAQLYRPTTRTKAKGKNMKSIFSWLNHPPTLGPDSTLLLRVMAGGVFLWEGILKFVYVNQGIGRFTKLGMPMPHFTANFVASLEIGGGVLLLFGFLTRWISVPFIIEMIVAMLSTKISLYFGTSPLPRPPAPPQIGIWAVLHEVRSEYAQAFVVAFLLINGPGRWSLDALFSRPKVSGLAQASGVQRQAVRAATI
jgi:putative oxidoreductase